MSKDQELELLKNDVNKLKDENKDIKNKIKSNNSIIDEKERTIRKIENSICLDKYGFCVDDDCLETLPCKHYVSFKYINSDNSSDEEDKLMNSVRIRDLYIKNNLPIPEHFNVNDRGHNINK